MPVCTHGWESLRGDSLGWLLDETRPNLHWRVLVELIGRPEDSPAARRARGGANVCEPVASLLADLHPDGSWGTEAPLWAHDEGPGWRLIAAVQWGADPEDPRLHAASERILETAAGDGGLVGSDGRVDALLTARALEAMTALGWRKHRRVQEWLAWFEESDGWRERPAVAVAVASSAGDRPRLLSGAVEALDGALANETGDLSSLHHPNLRTTDLAEIFAVLAGAEVEWKSAWRSALERLQGAQDEQGRWATGDPDTSPWITLKAMQALLTYAVPAALPRLFPPPPTPRSS